jgi:hypothetical protein
MPSRRTEFATILSGISRAGHVPASSVCQALSVSPAECPIVSTSLLRSGEGCVQLWPVTAVIARGTGPSF